MQGKFTTGYYMSGTSQSFVEFNSIQSGVTISLPTLSQYNPTGNITIMSEPRIIYRDSEPKVIIKEVVKYIEIPPITEIKEVKVMDWSIGTIVGIVVIVILVNKIVMKRLTWRYVIRKFKNLIWKPAKEQVTEIDKAWKED